MMIDETQKKMIEEYAQTIATNLVLYGVDIREKYDSAVSMSLALENAYLRGRSDGLKYAYEKTKKVGEWIPVSGRKPRRQDSRNTIIEFYFVSTKRGNVRLGFRDEDGKWLTEHGNIIPNVIAWMPKPEAYKGVEE